MSVKLMEILEATLLKFYSLKPMNITWITQSFPNGFETSLRFTIVFLEISEPRRSSHLNTNTVSIVFINLIAFFAGRNPSRSQSYLFFLRVKKVCFFSGSSIQDTFQTCFELSLISFKSYFSISRSRPFYEVLWTFFEYDFEFTSCFEYFALSEMLIFTDFSLPLKN